MKVMSSSSRRLGWMKPLRFKVSDNEAIVDNDLDLDLDEDEDNNFDGGALLKKLSNGMVPVAASVGFALTRSPAIPARVAGAALGGVIGLIGKTLVLNSITEPEKDDEDGGDDGDVGGGGSSKVEIPVQVETALETLRNNGPPGGAVMLTKSKIEKLAKKNGVKAEDLGMFFTHLFSDIIVDAVTPASMDVTELSDVIDFADSTGLFQSEIGDGFSLAATKIGRTLAKDARGFFDENYPIEVLYQSAKMFFLADKMLSGPTGYYGKRYQVSSSYFLPDTYREIVTEACTKLFRRCVESVLSDPTNFSKEEVEQLKVFLAVSADASTLRPANMQNLIMEAIQFTVDNALNVNATATTSTSMGGASITEDYAKLELTREILGWSDRELQSTVETRTMPLFENIINDLVKQVFDKPEKAAELRPILDERIQALNIDPLKARVYVTQQISEMNGEYMDRIDKVYNVSGGVIEPAFKIMASYATAHSAFVTMTEGVMDNAEDIPIPGLPFSQMVRVNMFEMQVDKGEDAITGIMNDRFDLNDKQQALVRKTLALPRVSSWIKQCIAESNFDSGAKAAYNKQLNDKGVTDDEWKSTAIDFYYSEAVVISKSKAIPSQPDMDRLEAIKEFLGCNDELIEKVNTELFGDKYVKALTEAMTPTGIITDEYEDGLERLRLRLCINEDQAATLLSFATRSRMGPIIKDLSDVWKSDTDASFRKDKEMKDKKAQGKVRDKGRDNIDSLDNEFGFMEIGAQKEGGGPNVFMREALNLVDFLQENYGAEGEALVDMPVTSVGIVPEAELSGMFKHYLITRLSEQDAGLRTRYVEQEALFANALGLSPEGQLKIKESLAQTAFQNMLKNCLLYKEKVEASDLQMFTMLKQSLQLDPEAAEAIYDKSVKDALINHAKTIFKSPSAVTGNRITADVARTFRQQAASLGLDLAALQFNDKLISYLYAMEVQELVEAGLVQSLAEVMEAYDIAEDKAQEIIEAACKRVISGLLNLALRGAKKYDEKDAIKWIGEVVKYAAVVSGTVDADGNLFTEKDKERLLAFYQADMGSRVGGLGEEEEDMVEKLREMIHLTQEFVAPEQGFGGLMGKGQSLMALEEEMNAGDGKGAWSWG